MMMMKGWPPRLRIGGLGLAGLVLMCCAWAAHTWLVAPRLAQRDALVARSKALPGNAGQAAREGRDAEANLAAFQRTLPTTASVPQWLGRIRTAALQSGLSLRSGDYKLERTADSPYLRYRITLPVTGTYGQIRGFVGTLLADVPAASVDDVQLKREGSSRSALDARIRLTLFIAAD